MKLFIGNLPFNITESALQELCAPYGSIVQIQLIIDAFSGRPKGFAFVEMSNRSEGHKLMEALKGKEFNHRVLLCNEAKPKTKGRAGRR